MPTYVYGCDACGHQFERFQKFSDEPIRECPVCQHTVRRIFQPAGIVFKGSGWHITDYKRSGNGNNGSGSGEGESKPTKDGEAKSEAKSTDAKSTESANTTSNTPSSTPTNSA